MSSLLTRFDLIFVMLDPQNSVNDANQADHVLNMQCVDTKHKEEKKWSQD